LWYNEKLKAQRECDSSNGDSVQRVDREIASWNLSRHDRLGMLRYALSCPSRRSVVDWRLLTAKASLAQCPVLLAIEWLFLDGIATAAPTRARSDDCSSLELLERKERSQSGAQRCHQIESLLERLTVVIQRFASQSGCFEAHTPGQRCAYLHTCKATLTACLPVMVPGMFDCWCYTMRNLDPLFRSPRCISLSKLHVIVLRSGTSES
jgi:hypothetical protein